MSRTMIAPVNLFRFALRALLAPALLLVAAAPAPAATFPSDSRVFFETGGCQQTAASADWYTTFQSNSTARYSEFFLEVTETMAPATVVILDAESRAGGPGDPVDEENGTADRTRFELRSGDGTSLITGTTIPSGSPNGTSITWTGLNVGLYRIRSYVGTDQIPGENTGGYCDQTATENDDDNSFRIQVNGASAIDGLLGFLQVTYEQQVGTINYQMYFLVGPALSDTTLQLRNFDLDAGASSTTYNKPPNASGAAVTGTVSNNGLWNGAGPTVNTGQDNVVADNDIGSGANDAGAWGYRINNWTTTNQTIFEANNTGVRLALTDTAPTRAGFFAITPSGTQATTIGVPVDHPFSVENRFFTEDVVNFSLFGTNPYYSVALRSDPNCDTDATDSAALTDLDNDGYLDTGLLGASGTGTATKCFFLRVTPNAGASVSDTTRINAVSLMDSKVGGSNTIRFVDKTTLLPTVLNKSFSPNPMAVGGTSTLTFTINNPNSLTVTGLVFGDTYPAGLVNAATPSVTNTCGGVTTGGVAGGNSIGLSGGSVAGGGTCTVTVRVTSSTTGNYVNTSSTIASTNAGTGPAANATLVVLNTAPPSLTKAFAANPIRVGTSSTLSIVLSNSNAVALTGVNFTDVFPAGMVVATPLASSNTCGGTLTDAGSGALAAGDTGILLDGATIAANSTCTVTVDVSAATAASYLNTTGAVTSTNGGTGNVASDTLVVHNRPTISKVFSKATMNSGDIATLTVTLANPNGTAMSGAAFTDTYPTNLTNAFVPNASSTCGGTVTAASNGPSLALAGGVIPANGSCVVTVDVTSTVAATYNNSIGVGGLTTTGGITNSVAANASITVQAIAAPTITKAFNTGTIQTSGTATMTIVVSNPNVAATLTGVAFTDTYPANLVNRNPANAAMTCSVGSTATLTGGANGGNTLGMLNGTILAGGSCTLTVLVTSGTNGTYNNSTGAVTSSNGGSGAAANASLIVSATAQPPVISKAFSTTSLGAGSTTTLTFTISNPNNAQIFNLGFTDTYPTGLVNAATPNVTSNCDGAAGGAAGTTGGVAGGNTIGLTGPAGASVNDGLTANASCTVSVVVTSALAGTYSYPSGNVQACTTNAGGACGTILTGNTATASVTFHQPTISKSITPGTIPVGGTAQLQLVLGNTSGVDFTGATVADAFPSGMTVASPLTTSNTCGGTLQDSGGGALAAGDTGIRLNSGTIPASGTCLVTVNVTASASGTLANTIAAGDLTTTNGGSNAAGTSANLLVPNRPTVTKSFSPSGIRTYDTSTLTITLSNNNAAAATGAAFTDNLPFGVTVTGAPSTDCASGIATATSTSVSLVGGIIPGGSPGTCTVTVNVTSDTAGSYTNTLAAGSVSASTGTNAAPASAVLNVLGWPLISKSFSPPTILPGGTSVMTIVVTNPNTGTGLTGVAFSDTYPSGLSNRVSGPAADATLSCTGGGSATLTGGANGGTSIGMTGGTLPASSSCTITVNVTSAAAGTRLNDTGVVTSTTAGGGNSASATLVAGTSQPTLGKAFSPTVVAVDTDSVLTLTLGNGNAGPLTGAAFTDTYPVGLVNSPTPNVSNTCGGTVTATVGGGSLALTGGTIPASGTCTITVNVRSSALANYVNTVPAGGLTTAGGFASTAPASASLGVLANAPGVAKSFSVSPIPVNGTSVLSIVVSNPNTLITLLDVAVSDTYPAGLVNRTSGPAANATVTCTAGSNATVTGGANGGNTLGMTVGSILPGGTCTVTANVTSASTGTYNNTTGIVSASNSLPGGTASATLVVNSQPTVAKSFTPASVAIGADSVLTVTLTNPNPAPITAADFTDTYPSGLVNGPAPAAASTCGGTVSAAPGGNTLQLAGGNIPASSSCTVTVNVRSNTAGSYNNTLPIGGLTAANGYSNTVAASATLTVQIQAPTISKAFVTPITNGDISRLTFTVTNPNPSTALSGITVNDVFPTAPAAMTVASPLATGNTCGGTLLDSGGGALANGDAGIRITGASLAAGASCTYYVDVTAGTNGTYTNTTGNISSTESGAGGTATAQMVMQAGIVPPTVTKTFAQSSLGMHGVTTMTLTFYNPNNATTLQRLRIADDPYPAGLENAPVTNITNTCGGNTTPGGDIYGGAAGGTSFGLQGNNNSLAANSSCAISISVTSDTGTPPGSGTPLNNNSTSPTACASVVAGGGRCGTGNNGAIRTGNAVTAPITFHRPTIAKAISPASIGAGGTAVMTITLANPSGVAMPSATFTDTFPSGMTVAAPLTASHNCGAGTLVDSGGGVLAAGDAGIRLNGGTIPAGSSCAVTVNVTAAAAGGYTNNIVIGALTANGNTTTNGSTASNAAAASAALTVRNRPTLAKAFSPVSIGTGTSSTLTLTLSNDNATAATGISFTDTYPAGLVNTTGVVGGTCTGVVSTATAGGGTLSVTDGVIPGGSPGTCTITIDVTGPVGTYNNTSGGVTTNETPDGPGTGSNTATLDIRNRPTIAKAFSAAVITPGDTSTLTFTLSNDNPTAATGITFTDTYPAGVVNDTPLTTGGTCTGVTTTASAGGGNFNVTAGSIPGGAPGTCTITVLVTAASGGTYNNTTSGVTSTQSGPTPGPVSNTATLTVNVPVTVVKSSSVISDPVNGGSNPKRIPGAVIEYTITVSNASGAVPVTNVVISDTPPANTTYVAGTLAAGGTAEDDDNSGADETNPNGGDYNQTVPGAVTLRIDSIPAGGSDNGKFRVQIQ